MFSNIVEVGARFAKCHSDAGFDCRTRQIRGEVKIQQLSPSGRPSSVFDVRKGLTTIILKGSVQFNERFFFEDIIVGAFVRSLSHSGGGVVRPNPPVGRVFGATEEGVREGGVALVYSNDCEGVLFTHKFVGALLGLASKVAIGEMFTVESLMSTAA